MHSNDEDVFRLGGKTDRSATAFSSGGRRIVQCAWAGTRQIGDVGRGIGLAKSGLLS